MAVRAESADDLKAEIERLKGMVKLSPGGQLLFEGKLGPVDFKIPNASRDDLVAILLDLAVKYSERPRELPRP